MHLKFANANIHSTLLFPHGFSPCSVLNKHVCAPTRIILVIPDLTETPASSKQMAKIIKSQMGYSDNPPHS